jgi:hypothetical protein
MKKLFIFLAIGTTLTSCKPGAKLFTTRDIPINRESIPYNPIVADLKVDISRKVTGTIKEKNITIENAKNLALYNAMETSGADVIVDPMYKIETKGKKTTATVTGYFGTYENVHKASEIELQNLKLLKESIPTKLIQDKTPLINFKKKK